MSFSDDLLREIEAAEPRNEAAAAAPKNPSEEEQADAVRGRIIELRPRWEEPAAQFAEAMAQIGVKPPGVLKLLDGRLYEMAMADAWYLRESVAVADGRLQRLDEAGGYYDGPILSGWVWARLRKGVDVSRHDGSSAREDVLELLPVDERGSTEIGGNDGDWQWETLGITSAVEGLVGLAAGELTE